MTNEYNDPFKRLGEMPQEELTATEEEKPTSELPNNTNENVLEPVELLTNATGPVVNQF